MKTDACPQRQLLHSHLLGQEHDEQADWLDQHIEKCDNCLGVLDGLNPEDELTSDLRNSTAEPEGQEIQINAIIHRGKQLQSEIETLEINQTISVQRGQSEPEATSTSQRDAEYDFLNPPEQVDEIGRLGDYRVLEVMGVGGMGVVFRAEDPRLKRQIALKAMKPAVAASTSAKERFLREAQATAAIDHDNIVSIYQVGEDRGIPFIAMRYLRGQSLQGLLAEQPQLGQLQAVNIARQVAEGLSAAHEHGLIHRDIKPDNIWLETKTDRIKILDFGLARSHDDDVGLTQSGMVLGTPKYMSPEQAKAEVVDSRCDLFSLGSVLYQLVSGKAPFEGGNLTATLIAVSQAECKPIGEQCTGLDAELADLITRLLAKHKDARPQSAREVAEELAKIQTKLESRQTMQESQRQLAETGSARTVTNTQATIEQTELEFPIAPAAREKVSPPGGWVLIGGTVAAMGAALIFALWAAGFLFKVDTGNGTLFIKVTNTDFATAVQGKIIKIRNTETGADYTVELDSPLETEQLKPGSYEFVVTNADGFRTRTNRFEIAKGEDKEVEVWWEPASERAKRTGDAAEDIAASSADSMASIPVDATTRDVAKWILRRGGSLVLVGGDYAEIKHVDQLPDSDSNRDIELHTLRWPTATDTDLAGLGSLKSLSALDLQGSEISGGGFENLSNIRGIEAVFLNGCGKLDPASLRHLESLRLTNLSLAGTPCGDETAQRLVHWKHLNYFGAGVNTTGVGLAAISQCKTLQGLDLTTCRKPNPADFAVLSELPDLNFMYLSLDMVNQEFIASLAGITQLRSVGFDGNTEVLDASVFIPLQQLTELGLSHTGLGIDDNDLPALQEMPQLRKLGLIGTGFSKAGIEQLHKALPRCEISWDGGTIKPAKANAEDAKSEL